MHVLFPKHIAEAKEMGKFICKCGHNTSKYLGVMTNDGEECTLSVCDNCGLIKGSPSDVLIGVVVPAAVEKIAQEGK